MTAEGCPGPRESGRGNPSSMRCHSVARDGLRISTIRTSPDVTVPLPSRRMTIQRPEDALADREQREEQFREFHSAFLHTQAEHIQRQTSALESIRGMLTFFTVLAVLGLLGMVFIAIAANQS